MPRAVALTVLCLLSLVASAATCAGDDAGLTDLVGEWVLRIDGGGEIYASRLELKRDPNGGADLVGSYEARGEEGAVTAVRAEQDYFVVEFETRRRGMAGSGVLTFGVIDGRMDGDVDLEFGTRVRSYEFSGIREGGVQGTKVLEPNAGDAAVEQSGRLVFRNGQSGYSGTVDTEIWAIAPSKPLDLQGTLTADGNNGGGESQVLMRFDDLLGPGPQAVPKDCLIRKATLSVVAFDPGSTVYLHRALVPWDAGATWDRMSAGVSLDNVEASPVRDGFSFGAITMDKQLVEFDVTQTVQAWANGVENHGWVFINTGDNGWDFYSSDWIEADLRPTLEIEFERR